MAQTGDRDPLDDLRSYANGLADAAPTLDPSTLHLLAGSPVPKRPHRFTVPAMAAIGAGIAAIWAVVGLYLGRRADVDDGAEGCANALPEKE